MLIVADTGPLVILAKLDHLHLLRQLHDYRLAPALIQQAKVLAGEA